jgi:hypothetical protein
MSNEELPLNTSTTRANTRKASDQTTRGAVAALDESLGNQSREEVAHGRDAPRRPMGSTSDMNLYVDSKYVSNKDRYYRWMLDNDKGRMQKAKDASYDFVTDEQGVNITRNSGSRKFYLMSLHRKFREDDNTLKAKNYNAMLSAKANEGLGVEGLETQSELKSHFSANSHIS